MLLLQRREAAVFVWFPSSSLGTGVREALPRSTASAGSDEYVPKLELGNEGKGSDEHVPKLELGNEGNEVYDYRRVMLFYFDDGRLPYE